MGFRIMVCGLVGVLVCVGCGSSKDDVPAPGAGGSGGSGGQDSGSNGPCPSKPPVDPSPDLNGRWAWKTVGSLLMPKGLTPEFRTRTVSIFLVDQVQTGTEVSMSAQYCDQYNEEDANAPTHVTIPDTYKKSLAPFKRTGTYGASGDGGVATLNLPTFAQVVGAHLVDPANDPLPTVDTDQRVFDQDSDGKPGITIKISGLIGGDLYVVQRQKTDLSGVATSADRVEGHYGFMSEQSILGSTSAMLQAGASAQQAIADPNACASTFTMVRMPATATCTEVLAQVATLFQ
jgi:hypothetical protein